MADSIQFRRGLRSTVKPLPIGMPGFIEDEERLVIGKGDGTNTELPNKADMDNINSQMAEKANQVDLDTTNTNIGDKSQLDTNDKSSIVNAVNEVKVQANTTGTGLQTTNNTVSNLQTQVTNMASGSPKGTYDTYANLQTAHPAGDTGIYIVTNDPDTTKNGHWFYWNGSTWADGGVYQSTGIANKSIGIPQLTDAIANELTDYVDYAFTINAGRINRWGELSPTDSLYNYVIINCAELTKIKITAYLAVSSDNVPLYVFKDSNGSVLDYLVEDIQYNDLIVVVPENAATCYINTRVDHLSTFSIKILALNVKSSLENINSNVALLNAFKESFNIDTDNKQIEIENTNARTILNNTIGALCVKYATIDKAFNLVTFPAEANDLCSYIAIMIIDGTTGKKEIKYKKYIGSGDYNFLLDSTYNLLNNIYIYFAYLDNSFLAVGCTGLPIASYNVDANIADVFKGCNTGLDFTNTANYSYVSGTWKETKYCLSVLNISNLDYYSNKSAKLQKDVESLQEITNNEMEIVLPSKLHTLNDRIYYCYPKSIIHPYNIFDKLGDNLFIDGGGSTYFENDFDKILAGNYTLNLHIHDKNENVILNKSVAIDSKPKSVVAAKVLFIGDSYIDSKWGDGVMGYMSEFATTDGSTVTFKGARNNYDSYYSEARSGWTAGQFLTNNASPFVFNGVFDFAQYLSTNNIGDLDAIIFFLGMNGGDYTTIQSMVDKIKSVLPNVKIIVCTTPGFFIYRENENIVGGQIARIEQIKGYIDNFDNREAENIYVCPTHISWERTYHYIHTDTDIIQFNLDSLPTTIPVCTNHHPTPSGAKSLAYMIYNYILYSLLD